MKTYFEVKPITQFHRKNKVLKAALLQQNYIQYSTVSMSKKRPLASFADVKFESFRPMFRRK